MRIGRHHESGATLVELLVAAFLTVAFFVSIFEVNAICLRYVAAGKETAAAIAVVNDRAERLRNLAFFDLTSSQTVSTLLGDPANTSPFAAERATEVITISGFPTPNGTTRFRRGPNGAVVTESSAVSLGSSLVQVEVACTWNAVFGGRERTERVTTVISNGTKK
jgi:hypothetical protein